MVTRKAPEALKLKTGDKLLVVVRGDGPNDAQAEEICEANRGRGEGYPPEYLERERKSWE